MTWTFMDIHAWRVQVASLDYFSALPALPPLPFLPDGSVSLSLSSISSTSSTSPFSTDSSDTSYFTFCRILTERRTELLCKHLKRLTAEAEEMEWQRDAAVEYATKLEKKYTALKEQLNAKEKEQSRSRTHRLIASNGARQRVAQEDAKRAEMKRKVEEAKNRSQEKETALQVQWGTMDGTKIYKGGFSSKSKAQLRDIATALSLSADGTKPEITKRIKEYLDSVPNLRQDQRFAGLYSSRSRGRTELNSIVRLASQGDLYAAPVAGQPQCLSNYNAVGHHAPANLGPAARQSHYHNNRQHHAHYPTISLPF